LFLNTEVGVQCFENGYSTEFPVLPLERKWHGAVSNFSIMLNGTFVLIQMLTDDGSGGGALLGNLFVVTLKISVPRLS
jgi:hypothetical protein